MSWKCVNNIIIVDAYLATCWPSEVHVKVVSGIVSIIILRASRLCIPSNYLLADNDNNSKSNSNNDDCTHCYWCNDVYHTT